MKHTPGPWKVGQIGRGFVVRNEKDKLVCNSYGSTIFEEQANAHLIASAPELLEACKNWKFHIEANGKEKELVEYYKPLKQAIAKAEGGK